MAVKDHSLDQKIIESATAEFLEHGFRGASLRQIAAHAGISTGALYTRYENKDVLFCSLIQPLLQKIGGEFGPMRQMYTEAQESGNPEKIMDAIRQEEEIYLQIMFCHYDQCILFFCRSDGSSIQKKTEKMMEQKAHETVEFFKSIARAEVDFDGVEMILSEQFNYYRQVLQKSYSKEKAVSCLKTVERFMEAGWKDLFQRIM